MNDWAEAVRESFAQIAEEAIIQSRYNGTYGQAVIIGGDVELLADPTVTIRHERTTDPEEIS